MYSSCVVTWCNTLSKAVKNYDKKLITVLLQEITDINNDDNLLFVAVSMEDESSIRQIIDALRTINYIRNETIANILIRARCPVALLARKENNFDIVKIMLEKGVDVDERLENSDNQSALHVAVSSNNVLMATLLLEHGADVNATTHDYTKTPLYCVYFDAREMINLLVANGANVNACNNYGMTPLKWALYSNFTDERVISTLLDNGARVNFDSKCSQIDLHFAPNRTQSDAMDHLLYCEINVSEQDNEGNTILHNVVRHLQINMAKSLLERGADLNIKNFKGWTPLHLGMDSLRSSTKRSIIRVQYNCDYHYTLEKVLHLCFEYDVDVNSRNPNGQTILQAAMKIENGIQEYPLNQSLNPIVKEIAKRDSQKLSVSEDDMQIIQNNEHFQNYYESCKKELKALKIHTFYKNISLYNVLTDNLMSKLGYAQNKDLLESFKNNNNYKEKYPIYSPVFIDRFYKMIQKQKLIKKATNNLMDLIHSNIPIEAIVEKIVLHLSMNDIYKLTNEYSSTAQL